VARVHVVIELTSALDRRRLSPIALAVQTAACEMPGRRDRRRNLRLRESQVVGDRVVVSIYERA
jgi:hypothetical protein